MKQLGTRSVAAYSSECVEVEFYELVRMHDRA